MSWPLIRNLPREFHFDFVRSGPLRGGPFRACSSSAPASPSPSKGLNMGIDFVGGAQIEVQTRGPPPTAALRVTPSPSTGGEDVQVQGFGSTNGAIVRFRVA